MNDCQQHNDFESILSEQAQTIRQLQLSIQNLQNRIRELEHIVEKQNKTIQTQQKTIENQNRLLQNQQETIEKQNKTIGTQQETIETLTKLLNTKNNDNSDDSNSPSSGSGYLDKVKTKTSDNKKKKKPRRAKKEHKGYGRHKPQTVDREVELTLDICPDCGSALNENKEPKEYIIEDIEIKKVAFKYKVHRYQYPCCKKKINPLFDADFIGPTAKNLSTLLHYYSGVPFNKIKDLYGWFELLVSDFYSAYNPIDCKKQKCLVHLLRNVKDWDESANFERRSLHGGINRTIEKARNLEDKRDFIWDEVYEKRILKFEKDYVEFLKTNFSNEDCKRLMKRLIPTRLLFDFIPDMANRSQYQ